MSKYIGLQSLIKKSELSTTGLEKRSNHLISSIKLNHLPHKVLLSFRDGIEIITTKKCEILSKCSLDLLSN